MCLLDCNQYVPDKKICPCLPNMAGNLLTLVVMSVHEDPLDQIVPVLVTRDYHVLATPKRGLSGILTVDEWNAWTVWMSCRDDCKISLHEFSPTNLETFLHNLGSKLVDAVAVSIGKDMVDDAALVRWRTMLAQMLDTPVAKLAMGDKIDAGNDFFNGRTLEWKIRQYASKKVFPEALPFPPRHSSRRCSAQPSYLFPQERPHATFHGELR